MVGGGSGLSRVWRVKRNTTRIIPDPSSLVARLLVVVAGHFWPLFSLTRSVRLVRLPNIYLIDIKWLVVGKFF